MNELINTPHHIASIGSTDCAGLTVDPGHVLPENKDNLL